MRRIGIAGAAVIALASASSAVVPQTASALCRDAAASETSNYNNRTIGLFLWTCVGQQVGGNLGGYSKIRELDNEGRKVGTLFCYRVQTSEEASKWGTNHCSGATDSSNGYFLSNERPWFAFRENAGKGKPVDKAAASGGEQIFKTTAGTIGCKALSLTEGEEPLETASAGLGFTVQYENCTMFGLAATAKPVELEFDSAGTLSLATSLEVAATNCTVTFPASENNTLGTVKYINVSGEVEIEPSVTGLTSEGVGAACAYARESKGTYSGKSLVGWAGGGTLEWSDTEKEHLEHEAKEEEEEFTGTSGASTLKAGPNVISCKKGTSTGELTAPMLLGSVYLQFAECTSSGSSKSNCTVKSTNAAGEGLVVTDMLIGRIGLVLPGRDAGLLLLPSSGTTVATLAGNSCTAETKVVGTVAGLVSPSGKSVTTSKVIFATTSSKNIEQIDTLTGLVKPSLTAFGEPATLQTKEEITWGRAIEVP